MTRRALTGTSRETTGDRASRELLNLLERYAIANQGDIQEFVGAGTLPQVSGVTMTANLKTVTIKWEPVRIHDVSHYVVQIDSTEAFTDPTEFVATQPQFTYMDGSPETTYYARVKVLTTLGDAGAYSVTVTNATELVDTADIADAAVGSTQIATGSTYNFSIVTGSPAQLLTTSYVELTGCRVSLTLPNARDGVRVNSLIQGTGVVGTAPVVGESLLYTRVERGDGASPSSWTTVITLGPTTVPTDGQAIGASGNLTDVPGVAGIYTYRVLATLVNPAVGTTVTIDSFNLIGEVFLV